MEDQKRRAGTSKLVVVDGKIMTAHPKGYLDQHCALCGNKPVRYVKTKGGFHKVCDSCATVLGRASLLVETDVIHAASMEIEYVDPADSKCGECGSSFGVHLMRCSRYQEKKNAPTTM